MKNKTSFNKLLEKINRGLDPSEEVEIELPEGKDYDIDSLIADVNQMKEQLDKDGVFMSEVEFVFDDDMEEINENPKPLHFPTVLDKEKMESDLKSRRNWEEGIAKINEGTKVYNKQKKQSFKDEQEKSAFKRLMGYEIPEDKGRIKEGKMWGLPQKQDKLVVIIDKEEAVLVKEENFDFSKLDETKQVSSQNAGHSLSVFSQLFETWYEYNSKDFEKIT